MRQRGVDSRGEARKRRAGGSFTGLEGDASSGWRASFLSLSTWRGIISSSIERLLWPEEEDEEVVVVDGEGGGGRRGAGSVREMND